MLLGHQEMWKRHCVLCKYCLCSWHVKQILIHPAANCGPVIQILWPRSRVSYQKIERKTVELWEGQNFIIIVNLLIVKEQEQHRKRHLNIQNQTSIQPQKWVKQINQLLIWKPVRLGFLGSDSTLHINLPEMVWVVKAYWWFWHKKWH